MALFVPKDRKSLFRQFLAGMYDAVAITDPNGHIIEVNARTTEHFGREPDELVDRHVSTILPALTTEVVQRVRKTLECDRHVVIDVNGSARDGSKIACEVTVSLIDLINPGDLIFTIRNVERRRAAMNQLRARANAFDLAPYALFCCDCDGNICDCNPAFLEMFGLKDLDEARTHVFGDFLSDDPLPKRFAEALQGETSETCLVAEHEGAGGTEMEITLGPNVHRHKCQGVVGSIREA